MKELLSKLQSYLPTIIGVLIIVAILCVFLWWFVFRTKHLKMDNVYFISGGVKTGKSVLSVFLTLFKYAKNRFSFRIRWLFVLELNVLTFWKITKLVDQYNSMKKPMLYTNMPLRYVRYNNFTREILFHEVRIPNKSVVLLDETSLIADSMLFKDKDINSNLLIFYKLWGHYSHGGTLVCNSQSISDNHFSLKRCMSRYLYIYSRTKLPFVTLFKVCERVYSDDNTNINVTSGDMETKALKTLVMPNFVYKFYDCFYLSVFTDDLRYQVSYDTPIRKRKDSLKADDLVSLQDFKVLDKRVKVCKVKENQK